MTSELKHALAHYWGYDAFLPFQEEAMQAVVSGRDSLVVLPTGGGKSLCFQTPAVTLPGLTLVISPLIALMKDQVDALAQCGVRAGRLDSTQDPRERDEVFDGVQDRSLKLLYVSPERVFANGFIDFLRNTPLSAIAVDEAHCVSMWGHDFRPEYRRLGDLKVALPGVPLHAYTATATGPVREDIVRQLRLENTEVLVGSFDRPNLKYKVEQRSNEFNQVRAVADRYPGESGVVYCISRKKVDKLADKLNKAGYRAAPYHAGMEKDARARNQELFLNDEVDIIVATVAFGMGIDKSNVRYVIHAAMPKSLEHYQQESGRAGRDRLDAECLLLYSGSDYMTWTRLLGEEGSEGQEIALAKLRDMYAYCGGVACRHDTLLRYFGQRLDKEDCGACDVCLGDLDILEDSLLTSQKILSCVKRLRERFGGDYTAQVLTGSSDQRILQNGHDELSTYGLLADRKKKEVREWIEQLVGQGYLTVSEGEFATLEVTQKGVEALRGNEPPRLLKPVKRAPKKSKAAVESWEGVDAGLFEALRELRREISKEKGVPAFVVFGDAALRDMAARRPRDQEGFLSVRGVGDKKREEYGEVFLDCVTAYCEEKGLDTNVPA